MIFASKLKIVEISSLKKLTWCALFYAVAAIGISQSSGKAQGLLSFAEQSEGEAKYLKILNLIYDEVKELGPYPGEDFIRREFFIGKDDDDTNKNQHVVVLILNIDGQEKMRLQVTYLEPTKENPQVKYAKDLKNIMCVVIGNNVTIQSSDYTERELEKLAPEILRAIQDKKKLLKF